jgi:hypothetical protein
MPLHSGNTSADLIWGKKFERGKREKGQEVKEKGRK